MDKPALRRLYRDKRYAISPYQKRCWDEAIAERLLSVLSAMSPGVLALYMPLPGEPDILSYVPAYRSLGYLLSLPYMQVYHRRLSFWFWGQDTSLKPSHAKILVPDRQQSFPVSPDIVLLPCLAFHPEGYRLGYGGGYFDRTFIANHRARLLGISYEQGRLAYSDHCFDPGDRRCDAFITESAVHCPQSDRSSGYDCEKELL